MAEGQTADDALLDKIDVPAALDEEETREFVETALKNVRGQLDSNRNEAERMGHRGEPSVDEVLDPENVDHIQVRAEAFENPRVTVWLKRTSPVWANHAWRDTIYPQGLNAYNGKVETSFDVRPF